MMNYYTTNFAEIAEAMPANTRSMTDSEIIAYGTKHFRMDDDADGRPIVPANKFTAFMRAVADAIFDPADWKTPIYARCTVQTREWIKAAIAWFHGTCPVETGIGVYSGGYIG